MSVDWTWTDTRKVSRTNHVCVDHTQASYNVLCSCSHDLFEIEIWSSSYLNLPMFRGRGECVLRGTRGALGGPATLVLVPKQPRVSLPASLCWNCFCCPCACLALYPCSFSLVLTSSGTPPALPDRDRHHIHPEGLLPLTAPIAAWSGHLCVVL